MSQENPSGSQNGKGGKTSYHGGGHRRAKKIVHKEGVKEEFHRVENKREINKKDKQYPYAARR